MAKAAVVTTPFPSFAETANKYGLSVGERLEVRRAVDEILAARAVRRHRKTTPRVITHRATKKT